MKIDHIAIAVNDVEASAKVYQKALGIDEIELSVLEKCSNASIQFESCRLFQPSKSYPSTIKIFKVMPIIK